jgi:hypothetical protein
MPEAFDGSTADMAWTHSEAQTLPGFIRRTRGYVRQTLQPKTVD